MSDKENKAEKAPTAKNDEQFLSTWFGKFVAIMAAVWVLPTDKIFNQAIKPGWQNLKVRTGDGWNATEKLFSGVHGWFARHARTLRLFQIFILCISLMMLVLGLELGKRSLIVFGGIVLALDLLFIWVLIKTLAHVAVGAVNAGLLALDSTVLGIFRKVGLARKTDDRFQVSHSDVNEILAKGFVALPVALEAIFVLGLIPSWSSLLLFGLAGLGCLAISLISLHIGDTTVNGWRLASRANKFFIIALCLIAFLIFFLPNSFGKIADPGALDTWLVNPSWSFGWLGTSITIAVAGTLAWVLAGRFEGESGKRLTKVIPLLTGVAIVIAIVMMSSASEKAQNAYQSVTGSDSHQTQSSTSVSRSQPTHPRSAPNVGSANGMKMPEVDYKSGGSTSHKESAKPVERPSAKVVVPKVEITKKNNGFDTIRQNNAEIDALLGM